MWLRNGGGLAQLKKMLGHKDLATTQIYEHLVNDDVSRAQAQFAPTAAMGIFGDCRISRGCQAVGDNVSSSSDAGSAPIVPLFLDPAMVLQVQADRDRQARVDAAVSYIQSVECLELQGGRPNKNLPPEIAQLILLDLEAGHTKSAIVRRYRRVCKFSRTYLNDIIADGRLEEMAKKPPNYAS